MPSTTVTEADLIDAAGNRLNQQSVTGLLINTEISLPKGEKLSMGKVIQRSIDEHGKLVGTYDDNPILNSNIYEVEFLDGEIKEFAANILAETCLYQVDPNGHHSRLLDCITNVRYDDRGITKADGYNPAKQGQLKSRQTTIGWHFKIRWKYGTKQWVPLRLIKEPYPIVVADFVKAIGIDN